MEYVVFAAMIIGFLMIIVIMGFVNDYKRRKKFRQHLKTDYGMLSKKNDPSGRFLTIPRYFEKHRETIYIDDITWNDLNMDEIFRQMNHIYSAAGEEYLYYLLRSPLLNEDELIKREQIIAYFMNHEADRIEWQLIFADLGKTGKHSLYDYIDYLDDIQGKSGIKHYMAIFIIAISIAVMYFSVQVGIVMLVLSLCYNMTTYFKKKKEFEPYLTSFAYIMRLVDGVGKMEKRNTSILKKELEQLTACKNSMSKFRKGSFIVMSSGGTSTTGNPLEILIDYMKMIFHLDIIKFYKMLDEVKKHLPEIDEMVTIAGYIESLIAIGAFRFGLGEGNWCIPQFVEDKELYAQGIYHPLLKEPIPNDIRTRKGVLITGSNASGKSTFLKTIAINAIFAQTIHTCMGKSYLAGMFQIYSSMSLKDDVIGGDSYYMVEIKSLKRILDAQLAGGEKILCFVDEVLRGTNTVERIAASTQILRSLNTEKGLCFAATHDIELTHLLEAEYENYHFEELFHDGDILFQYKIMQGRAVTRNAIKLLQSMGYSEELTSDAERLAKHFMEHGNWG